MTGTKFFFGVVLAAYPIIVYFGLSHFDVRTLAAILFVLGILRLIFLKQGWVAHAWSTQALLVAGGLLAISALVFVTEAEVLLRYYPVLVNAVFLGIFGASLVYPPTVVERIARLNTPDLPPAGVVYTRRVTMVWCGFFVVNGSLALYTSLHTGLGAWATYNGVISYCLMGLLFGGEYLVRLRVRPHVPQEPKAELES